MLNNPQDSDMTSPLTPADILRHAEQLGWPVTEARAGEIAASAKATYEHMARATAKLDFDVDTLSLFAAREQCKESPATTARSAKGFTPPAISAPYPLHVTLTQAVRALRERSVSSLELTQAAIAAAKALQSKVNAFVRIDEESALATARACDADLAKGRVRGPLHGVPLAHKDMYYRKGLVSTCGSRIRKDWVAPVTASALEKLDAAGAVQIGTLNMTEFAYGPTGQNAFLGDAKNPWNTDYITGGSSSGSGVSVAARIVYGALGSDTAGSVRMPASICGVVGMKTSFGRVSRAGAMPLSQSLDTVGPLTRTVADNALILSVIAGHDVRDPSTTADPVPDYLAQLNQPVKGLRIGIPKGYFDAAIEPEVAARMHAAAEVYRKLGCQIVEVAMPDLDAVNAAGFLLTWGDVIAVHGPWMRTCPDDYTAQTRGRIQMTLAATTQGVADAHRLRGVMLREFAATVFSKCDAVLAANLSFQVPKLSEVDVSGGANMMRILNEITRLMRPVNVLGLPALAVPAGATPNGLPCGFQLIGRPFAEGRLYQLGHAYEQETNFAAQAPSVHST
jgi:aspartyl-tRNA(Asn)/glutamyl-tRNA(Gln) amidotransferase subunit A